MNYELAKQLKDAGFPQTFPAQDKFYTADGKVVDTRRAKNNEWALTEFTSGYAIPTLSELIEACGEPFSLRAKKGRWTAWPRTIPLAPEGKGATPEEAVARLWLSLHGTRIHVEER